MFAASRRRKYRHRHRQRKKLSSLTTDRGLESNRQCVPRPLPRASSFLVRRRRAPPLQSPPPPPSADIPLPPLELFAAPSSSNKPQQLDIQHPELITSRKREKKQQRLNHCLHTYTSGRRKKKLSWSRRKKLAESN